MLDMSSSEKISLKWNDVQDNLKSAFTILRADTSFTDVALVSEDGQQFEAHKVILSTSSPVLSNILKMNTHPNPVIYLMGFKAKELDTLLDFMYNGIANVNYFNLDDFLARAEELKLNGLTEDSGPKKEKEKINPIREFKQCAEAEELNTMRLKGEPGVKK